MISRRFTVVAGPLVVGPMIMTIMGAIGCSSPRAEVERAADPEHELLVEITVRAVAPDILRYAKTSKAEHRPLRLEWSEMAPILQLSQERDGLLRLVLNTTFWAENERLLEATALAAQLDSRKQLRQFAIARARQLRAEARLPTARPDTFWEELGLDGRAFARLREQPEFQNRVRAFRRQAVAWHLARAAARDLAAVQPGEPNVETRDQDRLAAQITLELLGSPTPPLVTALLTAGRESAGKEPSPSEILCRAADWIALGLAVLRDDESFQQRLEHSERLQISVDDMRKGVSRLRDEGRCDFRV